MSLSLLVIVSSLDVNAQDEDALTRQIAAVQRQRDDNRRLMMDAAYSTVLTTGEMTSTAAGRGTSNYVRLLELSKVDGPIGSALRAGDAVQTAKFVAEMGRLIFVQAAREVAARSDGALAASVRNIFQLANIVTNLLPRTVLMLQDYSRFAVFSLEDARLLRRQLELERKRHALPLVDAAITQLDEAKILSDFLSSSAATARQRAAARAVANKYPEIRTAARFPVPKSPSDQARLGKDAAMRILRERGVSPLDALGPASLPKECETLASSLRMRKYVLSEDKNVLKYASKQGDSETTAKWARLVASDQLEVTKAEAALWECLGRYPTTSRR